MKPARIIRSKIRQSNSEERLTVRAGKNGSGKWIYSCLFWPHSPKSISQARDHCYDAAEQLGYLIVEESD